MLTTNRDPAMKRSAADVAASGSSHGEAGEWAETIVGLLDAPAAVIDMDREEVIWASAAFETVLGPHADSVDTLATRWPALFEAIHQTREGAAQGQSITLRDGSRAVQANVRLIDESRVFVQASDISREAEERQRHLEDREQLLFTSRALSLGEMATTLAHEINQPVGTAANLLRGVVMRLQRSVADGSTVSPDMLQQALQRALDQVMFVAKVISRIREYTHLHTPTLKPVQPAVVMQSCAALLDWEIERAGVKVAWHVPKEAMWVQADELMLQQVLVNLMRNGIDAMRANPVHQRQLQLIVKRDGPQVELVVSDNGSGITEKAEQTLFTPFVSTKPTGTGIGLNICRSFIELHHGRLWFSRNESRGTSFHAALPLITPPSATAATEN